MYPLKAVLVGCSNELLAPLQQQLALHHVQTAFDYPDARATAQSLPLGSNDKFLFLIQIERAEQVSDIDILADRFPGSPILAILDTALASSCLLEAQRQGASQVIVLPLAAEDFAQALTRIAKQFGSTLRGSELIVVAGSGEGCGATSVAMGLAYALAQESHGETILVELALRLGRLANNLDLQPNLTTPALFSDIDHLDPKALKNSLIQYAPNLLLLPGPYRSLASPRITPEQVEKLLHQLRSLAPLVVVDLPATLDEIYFGALAAATRIVLVAEHSVPAIQALAVVRDAMERHNINAAQYLVLNRYDRKQADMKAERLEEVIHGPHFQLVPPHYEALRTAMNRGKFVQEAAADSPLVAAYRELARTVLARPAEEVTRKHESPLQKLLRLIGS